jgi:phospholipid/cholesterol/gamma-HCH transport system ATP-binding protein
LVDGKDLHAVKARERLELQLKMGMLFQKNALFDSLSVSENIAFPMREKTSLSEPEIQERVAFFLDAVGISHAAALFPDEISGGMQKRLGIARALALKPQIVLYDDPTAGLDPITSRRIVDLILQLRRENKSTVVAVTNDMARAYQLADRITMVVDGELIVTGTRAQTLAHKDPRVAQFIRGELEGPLTEGTA